MGGVGRGGHLFKVLNNEVKNGRLADACGVGGASGGDGTEGGGEFGLNEEVKDLVIRACLLPQLAGDVP